MAYKVIDIECIGEVYADKLNAAGVMTTELAKELEPKIAY